MNEEEARKMDEEEVRKRSELWIDVAWMSAILLVIAYPIGWLFAPEQPVGARFGLGIFAGMWLAYSIYMSPVGEWLERFSKRKRKVNSA